MGARQSKRSVDITTAGATPESGGEVVAGKLGKLEDGVVAPDAVAPKQNGDAVLKDKERQLDSETPENEKDSSTEKGLLVPPAPSDSATTPAAVENGLGDASPDTELPNAASPVSTKEDTEKLSEEEPQSPTSAEETPEVTSPASEEKQTEKKKEKKKKWSFRSISFSKKDKQKPSKKLQQEENGDIEKVPEEATDETAAAASGDVSVENGVKEEKSVTNTEENSKTEEVSACKKPESPKVEKACEKPAFEAPVQQVCEKPEAPKAEIICEKPAAPEKVCETEAVEPVPVVNEQVKVQEPAALDALTDPINTEIAKVEDTPKPQPVVESPVAEKPEKKLEEEMLSPAPAADEIQKEVCDNISPPPLPDSLPPSQVSVFAESMMAPPETVTSPHETSAPTLAQSETCPLPKQTPVETLVSLLKVEDVPASKDSVNVSAAQVEITAEVLPPPIELPAVPVVESPAKATTAPVVQSIAEADTAVESPTEKPAESTTMVPMEEKVIESVLSAPVDVQKSVLETSPVTEVKVPEHILSTPIEVQQNISPATEEKTPESGPIPLIDTPVLTPITTAEMQKDVVATSITTEAIVSESIKAPVFDEVPSSVELQIAPAPSHTTEAVVTESQQHKDFPSPPPSPASVHDIDFVPQSESLPSVEEQLPSPPPSPISALDTSISESGAANTNTEEQLPSPPPSPAASIQETSTDSPLPPPATEDLSQSVSADQQKAGSFDESAPLPPPPSVMDSMTTVEYNEALMCPPSPPAVEESLPVQQVTSNENIAEVSATESTQSEESIKLCQKTVTNEVDEKIPGMVMLDGVPPLDMPNTETSVAVAEN